MPHIVIFLHEFFSAVQHLKHCCHIIGTQHSVSHFSASNHCNSHIHGYGKKAYILKYILEFKKNLINIGCATLYHLSMTYITVYNLSINSNCRILAAELNYMFTLETPDNPEILEFSGYRGFPVPADKNGLRIWILQVKIHELKEKKKLFW